MQTGALRSFPAPAEESVPLSVAG
ncbi:uncharacterized protein METZ01_LOCUS386405, partial [marine metagenome]